jgi:hypothetical protein
MQFIDERILNSQTVCTSVGSTNVEMLCWVVILLYTLKNKQKLDVSSE